jgi:hypothetical protein
MPAVLFESGPMDGLRLEIPFLYDEIKFSSKHRSKLGEMTIIHNYELIQYNCQDEISHEDVLQDDETIAMYRYNENRKPRKK